MSRRNGRFSRATLAILISVGVLMGASFLAQARAFDVPDVLNLINCVQGLALVFPSNDAGATPAAGDTCVLRTGNYPIPAVVPITLANLTLTSSGSAFSTVITGGRLDIQANGVTIE